MTSFIVQCSLRVPSVARGIVGQVRAVGLRRGLRCSTYCTYWITNFVRNCFTNAASGTLRVPLALHGIKVRERVGDELLISDTIKW
jgi:hypothetical protein